MNRRVSGIDPRSTGRRGVVRAQRGCAHRTGAVGARLLALLAVIAVTGSWMTGVALAQDEFEPAPTRYQAASSKLSLATNSEFGKSVHAIAIQRGKSTVVETAFRVSRVAVGDPKTADFIAISDREIQILAREPGDTNMLVWGGGRLQAVIDINVEGVQPHLVRELSRILDNPSISVDVAGTSVVLRGHVPNLEAHEQAGRIAQAFLSRNASPIAGEKASFGASEVINLIEVGGGHQVMIEVVIAELRRNISRTLGVNVAGKAGSGSQAGTFQSLLNNISANPELIGSGLNSGGPSTFTDSVTLAGSFFSAGSLDLRLFLEALEATDLGTILAEPNLVARSGEEANFLVGGEIPIPVPQTFGGGVASTFGIEFKPFGVNVEFLPTVLSEDRIHMRVSPEVSEPDFTFGISILGTTVPAFQTRRVNTSIEVGNGEPFVLAGLLREDIVADLDEVPFMANVPILGQLFKSRAFQKKQTELVLFVTPHLVQPLEPGTKIALPTDSYIEPTMAEFYWDGRIEGRTPRSDDEDESKDSQSEDAERDDWAHERRATPRSLALGDEVETPLHLAQRADAAIAENGRPEGGFLGPHGHRLLVPRPLGVEEE